MLPLLAVLGRADPANRLLNLPLPPTFACGSAIRINDPDKLEALAEKSVEQQSKRSFTRSGSASGIGLHPLKGDIVPMRLKARMNERVTGRNAPASGIACFYVAARQNHSAVREEMLMARQTRTRVDRF